MSAVFVCDKLFKEKYSNHPFKYASKLSTRKIFKNFRFIFFVLHVQGHSLSTHLPIKYAQASQVQVAYLTGRLLYRYSDTKMKNNSISWLNRRLA